MTPDGIGPPRAVSIITEATPEAVIPLGTDNKAVITDTATLDFGFLLPGEVEQTRGTITFELFLGHSQLPKSLVFTSGPHPVVADPETSRAVVESNPFTPLQPGEYRWKVTYIPDVQGTFSATVLSEFSAGELSRVRVMHVPQITRRATVASRLGQFIVDRIEVIGPATEPEPTGVVTFKLFGPDDPDCSGPELMTTEPVPLTGSPPTARSKLFRPTRAGVYRWMFFYGGDENYVPVIRCGGIGATSVVIEHKPEDAVAVAELGVPERHDERAARRGRVIYTEVVDLLPLPGEVPDE
jgi:hypothetical protein